MTFKKQTFRRICLEGQDKSSNYISRDRKLDVIGGLLLDVLVKLEEMEEKNKK